MPFWVLVEDSTYTRFYLVLISEKAFRVIKKDLDLHNCDGKTTTRNLYHIFQKLYERFPLYQ